MRGVSLRLKINTAILLAFLAAAAAFGGVLRLYMNDRQAAAQNRTRTLLGVLAAHRLENLAPLLHVAQAANAAADILNRLVRVDGVTEASLFTATGRLVATAGDSAAGPLANENDGSLPTGRVFTVSAKDDRLTATLVEPIRDDKGQDLGFLRLRYALQETSPLAAQVWTIFALAVVGAYIFLAGLLNLMLHRFVLEPVDTLRQALEAVEAGDLDQSVPVNSADALGRVGTAFNAMAARLRETSRWLGESRAEVEEHRLLLARRVEERTAELATANTRLVEEIEARRRAEELLSRQMALYIAILESTAEAVVCVSAAPPNFEVLALNQRFLEIWNLPPDWATGENAFQRFSPILNQIVGAQEVRLLFHRLMADTESLSETCLELHDGRYIERRSGPIRQDGVYIGRVFSYIDVTTRHRAENSLRQALAQRDVVLGNTQVGLATTRGDICTDINARGAEMLGYPQEELIGRNTAELLSTQEQDMVAKEQFDQVLASQGSISQECRVVRKDGQEFWIRIHGKRVNPEAPDSLVVWAFDDITQEKQRQASLEQAKTVAEEASQAKGVFLAVMSHEIRTPLNAVMGLTDVLLAGPATPEQLGHLRTIRDSAGHLLGVVNDILDFSKIEAGKLILERIDFDVREVIAEAARTVALAASQKGLAFTVSVDAAVPTALRGDAGRLRQVLLNFLGNAVKFTAAGTVSLTVAPVAAPDTPPGRVGLAVTVSDTGIGVDPTRSAELFESFNQGPGHIARRFGGTGLGLAISKELVERMGGHIAVASRLGAGSVFSFTVFLLPGNADAVIRRAAAPAGGVAAGQKTLRILLVEDNELNAAVTRLHMGRMGHTLTVADSARQAYAALAQQRFDAVLMDIEMPEIDGITATRTIRNGGPAGLPALDPGVPIIAVTAHAVEDVRQQCLESGMDGFVTKPVNYRTLQDTLEAIWRGNCPLPSLPSQAFGLEVFAPGKAREAMGLSWPQFRGLLHTSYDEGSKRLAEARLAVENGDHEQAVLAAHTFKGTAATIGSYASRQAAVLLEQALGRHDAAEIQSLLDQMQALWNQVRLALETWTCPDEG
ncbi:ATP-binding protein [Desulfovibrio sp. TomC]|uniref:ATP-binding protein n=1 Tax=Desulfovibrio sp. TomC TaxID=1562888 RepID=UPI0005751A92|nr:ATP-binding protein [Desulfovibrio sp. TomC]KHK02322.1 Sensory box histidine kinase/response regulator [Desulfovibrio sp. TomC]